MAHARGSGSSTPKSERVDWYSLAPKKNGGGDPILAATGFWLQPYLLSACLALMQDVCYSIAPASAEGGGPGVKSRPGI